MKTIETKILSLTRERQNPSRIQFEHDTIATSPFNTDYTYDCVFSVVERRHALAISAALLKFNKLHLGTMKITKVLWGKVERTQSALYPMFVYEFSVSTDFWREIRDPQSILEKYIEESICFPKMACIVGKKSI